MSSLQFRQEVCLCVFLSNHDSLSYDTGFPIEPRPSPSPEPPNAVLLAIPATLITLCLLFILFRRASNLKTVVQHQQVPPLARSHSSLNHEFCIYRLRTWRQEGAIRLSTDEGPPARSFVDDEDDAEDGPADSVGSQRRQGVQRVGDASFGNAAEQDTTGTSRDLR